MENLDKRVERLESELIDAKAHIEGMRAVIWTLMASHPNSRQMLQSWQDGSCAQFDLLPGASLQQQALADRTRTVLENWENEILSMQR